MKYRDNFNFIVVVFGVNWMVDDVDWGWNVIGFYGIVVLCFEEDDILDSCYWEILKDEKESYMVGVVREILVVVIF